VPESIEAAAWSGGGERAGRGAERADGL